MSEATSLSVHNCQTSAFLTDLRETIKALTTLNRDHKPGCGLLWEACMQLFCPGWQFEKADIAPCDGVATILAYSASPSHSALHGFVLSIIRQRYGPVFHYQRDWWVEIMKPYRRLRECEEINVADREWMNTKRDQVFMALRLNESRYYRFAIYHKGMEEKTQENLSQAHLSNATAPTLSLAQSKCFPHVLTILQEYCPYESTNRFLVLQSYSNDECQHSLSESIELNEHLPWNLLTTQDFVKRFFHVALLDPSWHDNHEHCFRVKPHPAMILASTQSQLRLRYLDVVNLPLNWTEFQQKFGILRHYAMFMQSQHC